MSFHASQGKWTVECMFGVILLVHLSPTCIYVFVWLGCFKKWKFLNEQFLYIFSLYLEWEKITKWISLFSSHIAYIDFSLVKQKRASARDRSHIVESRELSPFSVFSISIIPVSFCCVCFPCTKKSCRFLLKLILSLFAIMLELTTLWLRLSYKKLPSNFLFFSII